jgi:uncharacterized membrane protein YhaH (DUF805 family)
VFRKYADFSGRARRTEFWMFVLFVIVVSAVLLMVDYMMGTVEPTSGYGVLSGVFALATLLPYLAVGARRLHDTGRTGWWWLIGFVPVIGTIVLIVFFAKAGDAGSNAYGPDPKAAVA